MIPPNEAALIENTKRAVYQAGYVWVKSLIREPGLEVIKLEYKLRLEIKRNDWLLADTRPQTANHRTLF